MKETNRSLARNIAVVCAIVVGALAVRGVAGATKQTYHIDEGYSAALTNGDWVPGKDLAVHDKWITSDSLFSACFIDHLAAAGKADFAAITNATGLDVHPPLYYWIFAIFRLAFGAARFAFAGYALNMILFVISCALFAHVAWRTWRNWPTVFLALVIFAFSSTAISLTIFIRMYELLQTLCLAFFALALLVLFPFEGKVIRIASLGFGVAGLFVVSFLGLMTQYYFLLFVAPVAAFALVYLVAKKRTSTLLWSVLAVGAGFYLAYRAFPQMKDHLTLSYRAGQSIKNLVNPDVAHKLATLVAYLKILSANLVPAVALVAVAVMAIVARIQKAGAQTRRERTALEVPVFVMTVAVFAVTFVVVSVSAPYQTARYIGAFFPIYALAFVGFTRVALPSRSSLVILCASAILVFAHGVQPANICEFHEDYPIDKNSFYMSDSKPVILMATPEGGSWKNMLPYLNFSKGKRVYVAYNSIKAPIAVSLGDIAKSSGEKEVYAIVDDYFAMQPPFEKIGYYGFYFVYRIRVE